MATKLVLLGTAGGPVPRSPRHAPSQVVVVDGHAYVIDCGNGVAQQLQLAGISPSSLRAVLVTHHHSDHNADLGNLFLLSWPLLTRPVPVLGPPPLSAILRSFFEMSRYDIEIRVEDEGRPHLSEFVVGREIAQPGVVFRDDKIEVRAALVEHPPVQPAFAFRIDTADRSVVISGDTRPCNALVELARGADVLVHEVIHLPAIGGLAEGNNGTRLFEHLRACHTPVDQVGALAERAGVGTLVLSHFVPASGVVPDEVWQAEAARGYSGRVVVGRDLLEL